MGINPDPEGRVSLKEYALLAAILSVMAAVFGVVLTHVTRDPRDPPLSSAMTLEGVFWSAAWCVVAGVVFAIAGGSKLRELRKGEAQIRRPPEEP